MNNDERFERIIDFLLNVYDEVEDPQGALVETLEGDEALAEYLLGAWQSLAKTDSKRFLSLMGPECGDVGLREWLATTLRDRPAGPPAPGARPKP